MIEEMFKFKKYRRELKAAGISAVAVGIFHWLGHNYIVDWFPNQDPVMVVGATVVLTTFLIAYGGMVKR
jgi:cyclopropane fatty-acyl-phospholipid synthase-like methyltransferase